MDVGAIIAVVSALSGIALGWLGRTRTIRQDAAQDAGTVTGLQTDLNYIKRGVDDIRVDVRIQGQELKAVTERVVRVEESYKSLHNRIDRMEGK